MDLKKEYNFLRNRKKYNPLDTEFNSPFGGTDEVVLDRHTIKL